MQQVINLSTRQREVLVDITEPVKSLVRGSDVRNGLVSVYAQGATAAIIACTELSALGGQLPIDALDAAEILAQEIVAVAKNRKDPA